MEFRIFDGLASKMDIWIKKISGMTGFLKNDVYSLKYLNFRTAHYLYYITVDSSPPHTPHTYIQTCSVRKIYISFFFLNSLLLNFVIPNTCCLHVITLATAKKKKETMI